MSNVVCDANGVCKPLNPGLCVFGAVDQDACKAIPDVVHTTAEVNGKKHDVTAHKYIVQSMLLDPTAADLAVFGQKPDHTHAIVVVKDSDEMRKMQCIQLADAKPIAKQMYQCRTPSCMNLVATEFVKATEGHCFYCDGH